MQESSTHGHEQTTTYTGRMMQVGSGHTGPDAEPHLPPLPSVRVGLPDSMTAELHEQRRQLFSAARNGNLADYKKVSITVGSPTPWYANLFARDENNRTPLIWAAVSGRRTFVASLRQEYAPQDWDRALRARDSLGLDALAASVVYKKPGVLEELLSQMPPCCQCAALLEKIPFHQSVYSAAIETGHQGIISTLNSRLSIDGLHAFIHERDSIDRAVQVAYALGVPTAMEALQYIAPHTAQDAMDVLPSACPTTAEYCWLALDYAIDHNYAEMVQAVLGGLRPENKSALRLKHEELIKVLISSSKLPTLEVFDAIISGFEMNSKDDILLLVERAVTRHLAILVRPLFRYLAGMGVTDAIVLALAKSHGAPSRRSPSESPSIRYLERGLWLEAVSGHSIPSAYFRSRLTVTQVLEFFTRNHHQNLHDVLDASVPALVQLLLSFDPYIRRHMVLFEDKNSAESTSFLRTAAIKHASTPIISILQEIFYDGAEQQSGNSSSVEAHVPGDSDSYQMQ